MSEYKFVEKPFLSQLEDLGWEVIDQGDGIPKDPTKSRRTSFREVTLKEVFREQVRALNTLPDGTPWLTDRQLEHLHGEVTDNQAGKPLLAANEAVLNLLFRAQADRNELTGEEYPDVKLIDFEHPERNSFIAINQFRIDTPGCVKDFIIPDIVLLVNGLPLVVVECKDINIFTANPMYEAYKQLRRYSNQREETQEAGLKEGEERLFHCNQFLIATCGEEAKFGTITSTEEYFFAWKDITHENHRHYEPPLGKERQQEVMIQGMLPPTTLLDILRNCTLFMDTEKSRVKVVSRYQQYRAMHRIIERLRRGKTPRERSGVIWHTQGSGKSLTMMFLTRKLRSSEDLRDYKVILVNDRTDLEDQLGRTARVTGEPVTVIKSSAALKKKLANEASNLNLVMIHKFQERDEAGLPYLGKQLPARHYENIEDELVPVFKHFGMVNNSERIIIMIDEAHRTQSSDLGDNLFDAFPNATRLAFTGTPLIRDENRRTVKRFGPYIDTYKLKDAEADGATVQILYEGKTADVAINAKHQFDRKFFDMFKDRTDEQIIAIKKRYGTHDDIMEAEGRIEEIAVDLVEHYVTHILPNGFKAQVVSSSKMAAVRYKTYIDKALTGYMARLKAEDPADEELIRQVEFLKTAVLVSQEGTNEKAVITAVRKHAREVNARENFTKGFNYGDPEKAHTGIAFLIVCDMLLTGFDAPIEQVMYLDKKLRWHNLLQAIARVNRVARGKQRGYVVDYVGIANHLQEALSIYSGEDLEEVKDALKNITSELPLLEERYQRLLSFFRDDGVIRIEEFVTQRLKNEIEDYEVLEETLEYLKDMKKRAAFEVFLKKFLQSLDIVLPEPPAGPYKIPAKRFGYILVRARFRYRDDSLSLGSAGEKVKKLINEHLIGLGIDPKIPPVDLLSDNFISEVKRNRSDKATASEMEHAIRKHIKVEFGKDPAFYEKMSEKLHEIIERHKENWEQLVLALKGLREGIKKGREKRADGISAEAAPFYDLVVKIAYGKNCVSEERRELVKDLVLKIMMELEQTIAIVNFWNNTPEVSRLKGEISDLILFTGIDELIKKSDRLVTEIAHLARVRS